MVGTLPGDNKAETAALPCLSEICVLKSDIALWDSTSA